LGELPTLVSRSRDLVRNHGVAAGAMQTLCDNVVGTGLRLSATPDYKALGKDKAWADEWARGVESQWRAWAESTACDAANSLNFAGLTNLVFRSSLINGEALALPLWLDKRGNDFATTQNTFATKRCSNRNTLPILFTSTTKSKISITGVIFANMIGKWCAVRINLHPSP
jgi:capsid protein